VQLTADFTIGLKVEALAKPDRPYVVLIPNHKVVSKFNHADASSLHQSYVSAFAKAAEHLTLQGMDVVLVNHEGREDAAICQEISALTPCRIVQIEDPLALKQFIGAAELVISSRFHGAINALSQAVPCIATSWSHKYQQMMTDFGVGDFCIEQLTAETLLAKIALVQQAHSAIVTVLTENSERLSQQNAAMWQLMDKLLPKQH
jgi:colanic acid/amylovoran biosynthesis protein